jgi:ABC-type nitrate/sulfonate/bicarbonate transport system ATPase subunit
MSVVTQLSRGNDVPGVGAAEPILLVEGITKQFETPDGLLTAVDNVSLTVSPGEFLGVIGPSGCGKSTLFNVIGGLLDGYDGSVRVGGDLVRGPHPSIGMIFQEESTFPWRSVIDRSAMSVPSILCRWSGSTASSAASRRNCRAACGSGCRWRERSRRNPRSC